MAAPGELVVATRNSHKLAELAAILHDHRLIAMPDHLDSPEEDGETFADNALIKARSCAAATAAAALADDSGIAAAALGGRPGVRSARFAGADADDRANLALLLAELGTHEDRSVAYVCALAYVDGDRELVVEGRCEGTLAEVPRGDGGFGYDPAFVPLDTGADDRRTMAELTAAEKHAISHRGRAARRMASLLAAEPAARAQGEER